MSGEREPISVMRAHTTGFVIAELLFLSRTLGLFRECALRTPSIQLGHANEAQKNEHEKRKWSVRFDPDRPVPCVLH